MDEQRLTRVSRYLSRHLRHQPRRIGISLDGGGWVAVAELLRAAERSGFPFTREELERVVAENDKQRFALDTARDLVRAQQGHSVPVELGLAPARPPEFLHHGTTGCFLASIRREGLRPMNRHAVHLSTDRESARRVGARRGRPVVLTIRSGEMHRSGHVFRLSGNGVWLVAAVPTEFITDDR